MGNQKRYRGGGGGGSPSDGKKPERFHEATTCLSQATHAPGAQGPVAHASRLHTNIVCFFIPLRVTDGFYHCP